jgi:hypothetical protein
VDTLAALILGVAIGVVLMGLLSLDAYDKGHADGQREARAGRPS